MRLLLGLLWLLRLLPYPLLSAVGRGLGTLLHWVGRRRRHIALTNLRLCFPDWSEAERARVVRAHFQFFARTLLDRSILWWSRPERIRALIRVEGMERFKALAGKPVILFMPHFVGMDAAVARLTMEAKLAGMYARQKNSAFDEALLKGRTRFGEQMALSRQAGTLKVVRTIRDNVPFIYLPDMDYGPRDSIFVPFFGVPAATITGLPRLVQLTGAHVLPCVTRLLPDDGGYCVEIGEPWTDFPGPSQEGDARRMNAFIEAAVLTMPEQYYWLHKRFKTRPEGVPGVY